MSIVVEDYHKNYGPVVAVAGVSFAVASGIVHSQPLGLLPPYGRQLLS